MKTEIIRALTTDFENSSYRTDEEIEFWLTFASNQAKIFVASRLFKDNIGQFFFCLR
jgi:hypothetical protein